MDTEVIDIVKKLQEIRIDIQHDQQKLEDTIQTSLIHVDKLQRLLDEVFDLTTAIALCKAGYFVQHVDFSRKESMHYYNGALYYEDGTVITVQYLMDNNLDNGWRIKKNPLEIDLIKLRDLHQKAQGTLLLDESFEDCFK